MSKYWMNANFNKHPLHYFAKTGLFVLDLPSRVILNIDLVFF